MDTIDSNMIDVLLYLFETYMDSDEQPDQESLTDELQRAGFNSTAIDQAFIWLEELALHRENAPATDARVHSIRVFTEQEQDRLSTESRSLLLSLEHMGVLSPGQRELVIDRLMALKADDDIDLEQVKWVTLIVLFSQTDDEESLEQVEALLFTGEPSLIH